VHSIVRECWWHDHVKRRNETHYLTLISQTEPRQATYSYALRLSAWEEIQRSAIQDAAAGATACEPCVLRPVMSAYINLCNEHDAVGSGSRPMMCEWVIEGKYETILVANVVGINLACSFALLHSVHVSFLFAPLPYVQPKYPLIKSRKRPIPKFLVYHIPALPITFQSFIIRSSFSCHICSSQEAPSASRMRSLLHLLYLSVRICHGSCGNT